MVTSLEFINKQLINVGEQTVTTLQSLNGMRGISSAEDALFEVCTLAMWPWVRDEVTADYWRHNVAYLPPDTHRVLGVSVNNYSLTPVSSQEIRDKYTNYSGVAPKVYCVEGMDESRPGVICLPYPTTTDQQLLVKFRRWRVIRWPKQDTAEVPVPDVFLPLVSAKLRHNLCQLVGAEADVTQAAAQEYDRLAKRLRTTLTQHSPTGLNMYRRNRR